MTLIAFAPVCATAGNDSELHRHALVRRPVAIVSGGQDTLLVANRDTGSVTTIDAGRGAAVAETQVSARLDDLVQSPTGPDRFFACDSTSHEVIALQWTESLREINRARVASYPVSVTAITEDGMLTVASLWSRRLTFLTADTLETLAVIDLPFAPLKQQLIDDEHLLIADAFGGRLAVVDLIELRVQSHLAIDGQNIRGLAITDNDVLLTHQILNVASSTTRSIISWGGVLSNTLHSIAIEEVLESSVNDPEHPDRIHGRLFPLGTQGRGAGDPGDLTTDGNSVWVALSGVSEVGVRHDDGQTLHRQATGLRPIRLLRQNDSLYAVCTSDDTITELDPVSLELRNSIPLGPSVGRNAVQRGEELFFDARLSLDGWFSCHSCHADGHTIGRLNDNLSDDSLNTPKRILTLLGSGKTQPWGWNGRQVDLRHQVRNSIEKTMAGPGKGSPRIENDEIKAIASYIASLPPAPGILVARRDNDQPAIERGRTVFVKHGCSDCHEPPVFTSRRSFDVGVKDEWGLHKFNPPSLLGVSQREAYFHDNRARRLVDVFLEHDHDGASSLHESDLTDLILFLKSL